MTTEDGGGALGVLYAELLCEAIDLHPGERVLGVDSDRGPVAAAATRRGAEVTLVDARTTDVRALPFVDDGFDAVVAGFETTCAADPASVASELARVCRPSGRIGLAGWTAGSLVGDALRLAGERTGQPHSVTAAMLGWSDVTWLRDLFGKRIRGVRLTRRRVTFRHQSSQRALEFFRCDCGPTRAAFASLEALEQQQLAADLIEVFARHNRADDGTLVAPSDYAEVVVVVR